MSLQVRLLLASKAKAQRPAAIGAEADVPSFVNNAIIVFNYILRNYKFSEIPLCSEVHIVSGFIFGSISTVVTP